MIGRICGTRSKSASSPSPTMAIISAKPRTTPTRWGRVRPNPYFTPDVINMRLFGPGVIEATKAKIASAQKISGWIVNARAPAERASARLERGRVLFSVVVLGRGAAPTPPRLTAGVEGGLRERGERARQRAQ